MTSQQGTPFSIKTGFDPNFVMEALGVDIPHLDAIFDLIDNSIDAARNHLFAKETATICLPKSYEGYEIKIKIEPDSIELWDNCSGIPKEKFQNDIFQIAKKSQHAYGIGHYGLGLKRALIKFGSSYEIKTDNGQQVMSLVLNKDQLTKGGDHNANETPSTGDLWTSIKVSNLHNDTSTIFRTETWIESLIEKINIFYSIFIQKGLIIKIQHFSHQESILDNSKIPEILKDTPHDLIYKTKKFTPNNSSINVQIDCGVHSNHKFGVNKKSNPLEEYGIYLICNDRVIIAANKEEKYGYVGQWHAQYNGYVCIVHIDCENPEEIPWNTQKRDFKTSEASFLEIKEQISEITREYKRLSDAHTKKGKEEPNIKNTPKPLSKEEEEAIIKKKKEEEKRREILKKKKKELENKREEVLSNENVFGAKSKSIYHEYKTLSETEYPIAKGILTRTYIECSLKEFAKNIEVYKESSKNIAKSHALSIKEIITLIQNWLASKKYASDVKKALENIEEDIKNYNDLIHSDSVFNTPNRKSTWRTIEKIRDELIKLYNQT